MYRVIRLCVGGQQQSLTTVSFIHTVAYLLHYIFICSCMSIFNKVSVCKTACMSSKPRCIVTVTAVVFAYIKFVKCTVANTVDFL